jgi:hypothetical protein
MNQRQQNSEKNGHFYLLMGVVSNGKKMTPQ